MRAQGTNGASPEDRAIWRRSQEIEAPADEAEHLLDLAALADNRLDEDDAARVSALIARDAGLTDDIATARVLADATMLPANEEIVARAVALVEGSRPEVELPEAELIAFPVRPPVVRPWHSAATWSGLAAAVVIAGWLGFDLGSGLSSISPFGLTSGNTSASELLDPGPVLLRDFTENSQI
jgi:anti-sigma factor RsiW